MGSNITYSNHGNRKRAPSNELKSSSTTTSKSTSAAAAAAFSTSNNNSNLNLNNNNNNNNNNDITNNNASTNSSAVLTATTSSSINNTLNYNNNNKNNNNHTASTNDGDLETAKLTLMEDPMIALASQQFSTVSVVEQDLNDPLNELPDLDADLEHFVYDLLKDDGDSSKDWIPPHFDVWTTRKYRGRPPKVYKLNRDLSVHCKDTPVLGWRKPYSLKESEAIFGPERGGKGILKKAMPAYHIKRQMIGDKMAQPSKTKVEENLPQIKQHETFDLYMRRRCQRNPARGATPARTLARMKKEQKRISKKKREAKKNEEKYGKTDDAMVTDSQGKGTVELDSQVVLNKDDDQGEDIQNENYLYCGEDYSCDEL